MYYYYPTLFIFEPQLGQAISLCSLPQPIQKYFIGLYCTPPIEVEEDNDLNNPFMSTPALFNILLVLIKFSKKNAPKATSKIQEMVELKQ